MKTTAAIMMIGLLILTAACTTETTEQTQGVQITKYYSFGSNKEVSTPKIYEVKLMESKYERDDRNLERFFPETLTVNAGDTVKISVMTEEANTISINGNGYGMKAGAFEFTPKEDGYYTIICDDCVDNPTALIRVV